MALTYKLWTMNIVQDTKASEAQKSPSHENLQSQMSSSEDSLHTMNEFETQISIQCS
jgi:hypothetical protein